MTRMLERPMVLVAALVVAVGMVGVPAFAAEQRHVVVTGRHLLFGGLAQIGAVTFIARTDDTNVGSQDGGGPSGSGKGKGKGSLPSQQPWWQRALALLTGERQAFASGKGKGQGDAGADFVIDGDDATLNRVDGRNHDASGTLVGSGDKPGVALDVDQSELSTSDVTIQGSFPIQPNIESVDVESYVVYLSARADTTYTTNTTLTDQTIGGPSDYHTVVVKDAKLTLKGTTTGYGTLVLYDTQPGNGNCELRMEDTAKWYGMILVYSGDTPGNSDKVKLRIGKQNGGGSGGGKGKGDSGKGKGGGATAGSGVQIIGGLMAEGRDVTLEFPNSAVGDIFYSSATIANADLIFTGGDFLWDDWRER